MSYTDNIYIMNIDYKSLLSIKELITFFNDIKESTLKGITNAVISINIEGIQSAEYDIVLDTIRVLTDVGFKIRLDNVDTKVADYFLFASSPNYIKVDEHLWKEAKYDPWSYKIVESKISTYLLASDNTRLMFDRVENSRDTDILKSLVPNSALLSGNYYSKERKLVVD